MNIIVDFINPNYSHSFDKNNKKLSQYLSQLIQVTGDQLTAYSKRRAMARAMRLIISITAVSTEIIITLN